MKACAPSDVGRSAVCAALDIARDVTSQPRQSKVRRVLERRWIEKSEDNIVRVVFGSIGDPKRS
tara:strand:- start:1588 stop:1779 length:192 start_codon:yes stop_codon:yes gene_type:complete